MRYRVSYRAAAGVGEEAHSRQRHGCLWSKPVNVETWRHVPDPIVMAHAFAELRYGKVAMPARKRLQMWAQFPSHPFVKVRGMARKVTDLDFTRRNTAHAWTDMPPPATFMVR